MRADHGYTLLELLVVLAIAALIVGTAPAVYSRIVPGYQVRQFANELAIYMRELREAARRKGSVESVRFALDSNSMVTQGTGLELPVEMTISFEPAAIWSDISASQLFFYPNGASNGGSVSLKRGNLDVTIGIDWVSGAVEVHQ